MRNYSQQLASMMPAQIVGSVVQSEGNVISAAGFPAPIGARVEIDRQNGTPISGEVIGFREDHTLLYPYEETTGIRRGSPVRLLGTSRFIQIGDKLIGRVVDAHGVPIDKKPQVTFPDRIPSHAETMSAVDRPRIDTPISTGIRTIDGLLTCGLGQRMGIFAGSGVGKSVLLGMMARYTSADINVIALIGERGREVNDFIERDLGPEGLKRSIVVVSTGDQPALLRVQAANTASAIAEYFRDRGNNVLLMMDSLTRIATAQREIGLAAGEPPTTRGFPPSVYSMLPRLVERAGRTENGSITAFYSVLVEGDDTNEPVSDTVRGLLDGHCVLDRSLAARGHYPAIDVHASISRLMTDIVPAKQTQAAQRLREMLALLRDHEDLISIGAYRQGSNPRLDIAIAARDAMDLYLKQDIDQQSTLEHARAHLDQLAVALGQNTNSAPTTTAPASASEAVAT